MDQFPDIFFFQRLKFKDHGPGQKRPVYLKIGILCGGSDKDHGSILYKGKQIVLLALIKPMNLVHEQDRFPAVHAPIIPGPGHHGLHIFFSGHGSVQLREICLCGMGDNLGYGGLSRARRPIKDQGSEFIGPNSPVKQLVLPQNMFLSHDLVQSPGTQAGGQRGFLLHGVLPHIIK